MKFAIVTLVLAVCLVQSTEAWWGGLGYGWGGLYGYAYPFLGKRYAETMPREIKPDMERTECVYNRNNSMIMCAVHSKMVECKTELRWVKEDSKKEFFLYGIGKSETTPRSYRLFPRTLTNSAWLDNTYNGKQVSLFSSDKLDHLGLRVIDENCFKRMVYLLKMSKRNEKVNVQSEDLMETRTDFIIGDLSIINLSEDMLEKNRQVSVNRKRHWGYGYGGYHGGYHGHGHHHHHHHHHGHGHGHGYGYGYGYGR